jgi:hypothetical protein
MASEFGKSIAKFGETLVEAPYTILDTARYLVDQKAKSYGGEGLEELTEEELEERERIKSQAVRSVTGSLGFEDEDVFTEEGEVQEAETISGAVGQLAGEIGAYVVPFSAASKVAKATGFSKTAAATSGAIVSEQLLSDPTENLFNLVDEFFPEASKNTFIEWMAADPEDSEITNRMKMAVQDGLLIPMIERGISFAATIKKINNRIDAEDRPSLELENLDAEGQAEVIVDYLEDARSELKRKDISAKRAGETGVERTDLPSERLVTAETIEGAAQVTKQTNSMATRFINRFLTSEGYLTPKAYNAFRDSQYAQRQAIAAAENIGSRLNLALKRAVELSDQKTLPKDDINKVKGLPDRVQEALQTDSSFIYEMPKQERLDFFVTKYGLPKDVAQEVVEARELMDSLGRKISNTKGFDPDTLNIIKGNVGNYMRRSYRAFEDPAFKPSSQARKNAVDYLRDTLVLEKPDLNPEQALKEAEEQVAKILGKVDATEVIDYVAQVRRVSKFKQKKDIPEPIRALLGEVTNPSESIILSVAKSSRIYELNNFYNQFNELGKSGGYLAGKEGGQNTVKISGTNSVLDGKYTTPEMLDALNRREEVFGIADLEFMKDFSTAKGLSQQMKTVFSHVTHIKNFLGATQSAIANGTNPFSGNGVKAFKTLSNKLLQGNEKDLQQEYEKYLRLGLVNTNVKVNEFRSLLETGFEKEPSRFMNKLKGIKYADSKAAQTLDKSVSTFAGKVTDVYVATDDFFKISTYLSELDTLKKAFPDEALDILEVKAARTVQDTIPNYDKVPKGLKALRDMPVGNFISFPAEVARTSVNIIKTASEEITSGNVTLARRGMKRLAGFATATFGWGAASQQSMDLLGWNEEEQRAHTDLAEGAFNKDSSKIWKMDEDGQLYFVDTRFLDTYEYVKRPIMVGLDRINQGVLRGDDLDEFLGEAVGQAAKSLLQPYIEESMLTTAITDAVSKANINFDQRSSQDFLTYDGGYSGIADSMGEILQTFVPGSVTSIQKYVEALDQKPNRRTGESRNAENELLVNMTGVRWTKYDPDSNLSFAISDYRSIANENRGSIFDYETDPDAYISQEKERLNNVYEAQQELFKITNAHVTLYGRTDTMNLLRKSDLPNSMIPSLVLGQFQAPPQRKALTLEAYNVLRKNNPEFGTLELRRLKNSLNNLHSEVNGSSLYTPDYRYSPSAEGAYREQKNKGGEVLDVPNVPTEPDQRIDKMTGLPYDQQAGTAFVDQEDPLRRLGFAGGGYTDPLQRLGFVGGGTALARGLTKLFSPTKTIGKQGSKRVVRDEDKLPVMTQSEELTEELDPRMGRAMESDTASSVMPAPGKFFNPESRGYKGDKFAAGMRDAGIEVDLELGNYLSMSGKPKDISNETVQNLFITARTAKKLSEGSSKSVARVNDYDGQNLTIEQMKENYSKATGIKAPQTVRTNLLQPEKFRVITDSGEQRLDNPIVAVEGRGSKHFYTLDTQFVGPVRMNKLTKKNSKGRVLQPNLRPETVGDISLGKIVGQIKVGKKTHPLYDYIEVDGTPSLPEGVTKRDKFQRGGRVLNALKRKQNVQVL